MVIEEIMPKREVSDKFECLYKDLSRSCDCAMDLLEDKEISKVDQDALVDIVANIKGSAKALKKLSANYSTLPKGVQKRIEEKSDAFVEGLGIVTLKKATKEEEE